jgi:hypothetical protein
MVKNKIVPEEMESISYFWKCPKCDRVIKGKTPNEVSFNGGLHLDSHKEKRK